MEPNQPVQYSQKIIEKVLLGLKNAMNFLDDVIVTGAIEVKYTNNLEVGFF